MLAELEALESAAKAVAALEPSMLSGTDAVELVTRLRAVTGVLDGVRLPALSTVKASGVWGLDGSRLMKAWLVRTTGCSDVEAAVEVKLADRLATALPRTAAALVDGAISVEHALAISRGACGTDRRVAMLTDPRPVSRSCWPRPTCASTSSRRSSLPGVCASTQTPPTSRTAPTAPSTPSTSTTPWVGVTCAGSSRPSAAPPCALRWTPSWAGRRRGTLAARDSVATTRWSRWPNALDGDTLGRRASVRPQLLVAVKAETLLAPEGAVGLEPATLLNSGTPIRAPSSTGPPATRW